MITIGGSPVSIDALGYLVKVIRGTVLLVR